MGRRRDLYSPSSNEVLPWMSAIEADIVSKFVSHHYLFTAGQISTMYNISKRSARRLIKKLYNLGIIDLFLGFGKYKKVGDD